MFSNVASHLIRIPVKKLTCLQFIKRLLKEFSLFWNKWSFKSFKQYCIILKKLLNRVLKRFLCAQFTHSQEGCTDNKVLEKSATVKSLAFAAFRDRARFYAIRQVSASKTYYRIHITYTDNKYYFNKSNTDFSKNFVVYFIFIFPLS